MIQRNDDILVTGANGFLGQHLLQELRNNGYYNVIPIDKGCDLRKKKEAKIGIHKEDSVVIHLAGNVGGIGYNLANPGKLFYDNIMIGLNTIEVARKKCVSLKKFILIGTICAYPCFTRVPFKENDLWEGYPEPTNAPYGVAKRALITMVQAYRKQYGFPGISLLPVNMYGPGDSLDPKRNHVIPALIIKFLQAVKNNEEKVVLWGSGNPTREFLYVKDAATAIRLAMENYDSPEPVNIGTGKEISILELAAMIACKCNYWGEIVWDTTMPDGQHRRCLDVSKAASEFWFTAETELEDGIDETIVDIKDRLSI